MNYEHDDELMRRAVRSLFKEHGKTAVIQRQTEFANWGESDEIQEATTYRVHVIDKHVVNGCPSLQEAVKQITKALTPETLIEKAARLEAEAAKLRELAKEPEPTAQEAACST